MSALVPRVAVVSSSLHLTSSCPTPSCGPGSPSTGPRAVRRVVDVVGGDGSTTARAPPNNLPEFASASEASINPSIALRTNQPGRTAPQEAAGLHERDAPARCPLTEPR